MMLKIGRKTLEVILMLKLTRYIICAAVMLISLALLCLGCKNDEKTAVAVLPGKLVVSLLEVNHGDAILLQDGKTNVLVDVGHKDNQSMLMGGLDEKGIKQIDTVIITHHHQDHMGNIFPVAKKYEVKNIYDNGLVNEKYPASIKLRGALKNGEYNNKILKAGDVLKFGDNYWLEILSPGDFLKPKQRQHLNNNSIVMMLHYGNFKMLLTGDIEKQTEGALVKQYGDKLKAVVLKIAHHGSQTSSIFQFVKAVNPKHAVISCGNREKYNHPHPKTTGLLKHLQIPFYNTEDNGEICIVTDGKDYEVKTKR